MLAAEMSPTPGEGRTMNAREYILNRNAWTAEQLKPFRNLYAAFSEDGKRILASAPSEEELFDRIDEQGLEQFVISYVEWFDDGTDSAGELREGA
jgi:hypothetical protein